MGIVWLGLDVVCDAGVWGLRAMICGGGILVWLVWVLFGLLCYKQHGFQVAISAL